MSRSERAGVLDPRRRAVLTSRSVVGGFLVAAAAVIVFELAVADVSHRGAPFVVAARDLPAGTVIGPGDTTTESVSLPAGTRSVAFQQEAALVGRTLAVAAVPGELIESSMLEPSSGVQLRPVSVAVDPDSLAGLVTGASVDVLATPSSSGQADSGSAGSGSAGSGSAGSGSPAVAVIVRGAELLAVSRGGSGLLPGSTSPAVATLGVTGLAEAEAVVQAAHTGSVTLIQAEPSDGTGAG
jgi:hypothetical protein